MGNDATHDSPAHERYIAIDDVCAWPNLTRFADGRIVATIFNQPTHGGWEGDVECWASDDDGRTWALTGVPAPHEAGTNRMNVAAGCAADGTFVVLASGWSRRTPRGTYTSPRTGEVLPIWVCRSTDRGATWSRSGTISPPPDRHGEVVPFGDIVQLQGDSLGVCVYGHAAGSGNPPADGGKAHVDHAAYFYVTKDAGESWTRRGTIRDHDANETTVLALPEGRLLAVARTRRDEHLDLLESDDDGETWRESGPVTLGGQHPGHLLLLRDGRILLSYGIRNDGLYGIGTRLSADSGQTWSAPRVVVNLEGATDCGYPSSVEAADGTIITVYYCNSIPAHTRFHMGVMRWRVEAVEG